MMLLLLGCVGEKEAEDLGVAGTLSAEHVTDTTETVTAAVSTLHAYGVNTGGEVAVLLVPTEATCEDAATYLTTPSADWNPEIITGVGTCSVYVYSAHYDSDSLTVEDDATLATVALNCAMGDGAWNDEGGDVGYSYDGAWWIGSPQGFDLELSGGTEEDFAVTLSMDTYTGSFTHDGAYPDPDPASGVVEGSTTATWCPDMGPGLAR
jgi:hypothetical protein